MYSLLLSYTWAEEQRGFTTSVRNYDHVVQISFNFKNRNIFGQNTEK